LYCWFKVRSINKKLVTLVRIKNPKHQSYFKESLAIGTGLGVMSLYDIYCAYSDHSKVFEVIEQRFPNKMGDADSIDWLNKATALSRNGDSSVRNYISNYAGEQGEMKAAVKLEMMGYSDVEQFESKTHANDDLRAINSNGDEIHFSVKSYADVVNFKQVVSAHPESSHYVVNSEIYEKLESSGDLASYSDQGIEIIDGGFSHAEHVMEGTQAMESMAEAADVQDDIPFLAIGFFGIKTFNNVADFGKGQQSLSELGVNVIGDTAGISVRAVGAKVGAEVGAGVGSLFLPGVGTVAGGIAGAVAGALTASGFVEGIKEKFKWGKIIDCIDHYGDKYIDQFYSLKKVPSARSVTYSQMESFLLNNVFKNRSFESN
jgi:hypothetical protein